MNKARGVDRLLSLVSVVSFMLVGVAWLVTPWMDRSLMFWLPAIDIGNWLVLGVPVTVYREWRSRKAE